MENNIEINPMNQDILAGKSKSGELKTWWGKLTDDERGSAVRRTS